MKMKNEMVSFNAQSCPKPKAVTALSTNANESACNPTPCITDGTAADTETPVVFEGDADANSRKFL